MSTSSASRTRAVVTVATGRYAPLQERLVRSLRTVGFGGAVHAWTELPAGSPSHDEAPYAFKLHALRAAARLGARSILWLDSPCVAAGPLDPVFGALERDGHLFVSGHERLGNWASDACLAAFDLTREAALDLPLLNGAFIGLDLSRNRAAEWLESMERACASGLFQGPYFTEHAPADVRARKPGKPVGFVSPDPRCWGHRHDEAVGSALAYRLGLAIVEPGDCFSNGTPNPRAAIRYSRA